MYYEIFGGHTRSQVCRPLAVEWPCKFVRIASDCKSYYSSYLLDLGWRYMKADGDLFSWCRRRYYYIFICLSILDNIVDPRQFYSASLKTYTLTEKRGGNMSVDAYKYRSSGLLVQIPYLYTSFSAHWAFQWCGVNNQHIKNATGLVNPNCNLQERKLRQMT